MKDVLVATDVASKGLDFPAIQHVVNYDMPEEIENYGKRTLKSVELSLSLNSLSWFDEILSFQSTELEELDDPARRVSRLHSSIKAAVRKTTNWDENRNYFCIGVVIVRIFALY